MVDMCREKKTVLFLSALSCSCCCLFVVCLFVFKRGGGLGGWDDHLPLCIKKSIIKIK